MLIVSPAARSAAPVQLVSVALASLVLLAGCLRGGFAIDTGERSITCEPSVEAGPGQPEELRAPAARRDGLTLYAIGPTGAAYFATRAALDVAFGPWRAGGLPDITGLAFGVSRAGSEVVIGATSPNLVVCLGAIAAVMSCRAIELFDATGVGLGGESGGPTLALAADKPLLAFAHQATPSGRTQIYLGHALSDDGLLSFAAEPLSGFAYRDPTLSADGSLLLLPHPTERELLVAQRRRDGSYGAPRRLPLDVAAAPGGPADLLTARSANAFEVFWRSADAPTRILHARCAR